MVLTIEGGLLKILLNSSSVFPFNNSDSVGSVILSVVLLLLKAVLDSRGEPGVNFEIVVGTPVSSGIVVVLAVVATICSVVSVAWVELGDKIVEIALVVDVIIGVLVVVLIVVLDVEVLGVVLVLMLTVVLMLLGIFTVVVVVLILFFKESALASKFCGVVCSTYKFNKKN